MANLSISMSALQLQDVTHQLVQQFIEELEDMLDDLVAGVLSDRQKNILSKIVSFFETEMKKHHLEEEGHIFPVLLSQKDDALTRKVQTLQAEHAQLRHDWAELKSAIEAAVANPGADAPALFDSFERYSQCFAGHLALEESIQFSPETRLLFSSWDS